MKRVLVTGASGFVGTEVCAALSRLGYTVRAAVRSPRPAPGGAQECTAVGDIGARTAWDAALSDVECVVHLAARVHVMHETGTDPLAEFRRTNTQATMTLAQQAANAGVKRFVFLSSIKVNGEATAQGRPYTADDDAAPVDPYGVSKWEAEIGLRQISARTGLETVVIRPPLVYGPGVKANFLALMRWVDRGLPLPFGSATNNRRSLVAIANLVELITRCLQCPQAANQTFLAGDEECMSTAELLARLGRALGRETRLLPIPVAVLTGLARLAGRQDVARRLLGSLEVDIEKTKRLLNWRPVVSVDAALRDTAADYLRRRRAGE